MATGRVPERLRKQLSLLPGCDAKELVEEATEVARERVRALLVEAVTEAMLDDVCRVLSADEQTGPAEDTSQLEPEPARPVTDQLGWYVYCVVAANGTSPPPSLPGIDPSHETTTVVHGELAAVVSRVPLADFGEEPLREHLSDLDWLERTARTHEGVLELTGVDRTLIPMRMCSVYRHRRGVTSMLRREAKGLASALEQLAGKAEWGVKVFVDRDAQARHVVDDDPSSAPSDGSRAGREGTAYLRKRGEERRHSERADQRLEVACQQVHATLSSIAADALVSANQRPEVSGHPGEMIFNGVYLVGDDRRDRFTETVDALRGRFHGLELVLTGPWPAYNFVPGTIGAAW